MTLIERSFRERILLVGVVHRGERREVVEESLAELAALVDTAGADVVDRELVRRDAVDPATYVGSGKAAELAERSEILDVDTVVFDDPLSPAQQRNLERILGRTAIDRTAVILDVFAQNARSEEGRRQVELALLSYRLPRLRGRGVALSQQVGRIGTRGPGETKLEEDRRRIQARMAQLHRELDQLARRRLVQRRARLASRQAQVALVGYTNVGKSALLRALSGADVLVEDRLFATLDPRTRRVALPGGETILVTDTVGFIRKLPHELIESFRSTLEQVAEADLLLHIADASSSDVAAQIAEVERTLAEIGADRVPRLVVYNKVDLRPIDTLAVGLPEGVAVSAERDIGLDDLRRAIAAALDVTRRRRRYVVPAARGDVVALVHREGAVVREVVEHEHVVIDAVLDDASDRLVRRALGEVPPEPLG